MINFDYITLILAGGEGTRLSVLTKETPKPAVIFGGVHRLIDFPLSNCTHSTGGSIGVITQYCGHELADYIGCGSHWHPKDKRMGITMLPPQVRNGRNEQYTGTADAILKNSDFIEQHNSKNVVVLSGDHVYKMNYAKMLKTHTHSGAAVTIAAVNVPLSEASRFGIMLTDRNNIIIDFEEKPKSPKSYLASMGVYVFDWEILKKYLLKAGAAYSSGVDIGRDIIPEMLVAGEKLAAHRFHGYWKDVGNIYSLWEANMELLSSSPGISLHDDNWRIIGRNKSKLLRHKHFRTDKFHITDSFIADSSTVEGVVTKSVISNDVEIGKDAKIIDSVIMPGAKIGKGAVVLRAIVGSDTIVEDYTAVGGVKPDGRHLDNCQGVSVVGCNTSVFTQSDGQLSSAAISPLVAHAV